MTDRTESRSPTTEAAVLNPYAGTHAVSGDPLEVEAARRAGDRSLAEFPYFLHRYGDRARLFALSDGGWLATICGSAEQRVHQEVDWLARVLASRGMPAYLLERHLEFLAEELTRARPSDRTRYERLASAASHLRERRRTLLDEDTFEELAGEFERLADPDPVSRLPRCGRIVVAAVVDEAAGVENALPSLSVWFRDPERFPDTWNRAFDQVVEATRARIARTPGARAANPGRDVP